MCFIRYGSLVVGLFLILGCGTKIVTEPETKTKAIVPEYVINAKEFLGTGEKESRAKLLAMSDFRSEFITITDYVYFEREYGRVVSYFVEAKYSPENTYIFPGDKAYLSLSFTDIDKNARGSEVGRMELTHVGIVSADEAVMMLGYDPKQLIEHPVKHRNAERSDWFALIDPYFHIIEIQWFDAKKPATPGKLGKVTQIRVSVW